MARRPRETDAQWTPHNSRPIHRCDRSCSVVLRSYRDKPIAQAATILTADDARVGAIVLRKSLKEGVLVDLVANVAAKHGDVLRGILLGPLYRAPRNTQLRPEHFPSVERSERRARAGEVCIITMPVHAGGVVHNLARYQLPKRPENLSEQLLINHRAARDNRILRQEQ